MNIGITSLTLVSLLTPCLLSHCQVSNIESNLRQLLLDSVPPLPPSSLGRLFDPSPAPTALTVLPPERDRPWGERPSGVPVSVKTPPKSRLQNEFAIATGGYSKRSDIPGSMYSPGVSPTNIPPRRDTRGGERVEKGERERDPSPSECSVLSSHSQEYLYSVAQLQAHSGVKIPGLESSPPRPRAHSMAPARPGYEEPSVDRLHAAAKMLERDLASRPKEDHSTQESYTDNTNANSINEGAGNRFDPRTSSERDFNSYIPSRVTPRGYLPYKAAPSPKVPLMETYDGKSGRRLFSAPPSVVKGAGGAGGGEEEEKTGYEVRVGSPRRALERARGLISRIEGEVDRAGREASDRDRDRERERDSSHRDRDGRFNEGEGYELRNGGHESPLYERSRSNGRESARDGRDRDGSIRDGRDGMGSAKRPPSSSSSNHASYYDESSPPSRPQGWGGYSPSVSQKRSKDAKKSTTALPPSPIRQYISPQRQGPSDLTRKPFKVLNGRIVSLMSFICICRISFPFLLFINSFFFRNSFPNFFPIPPPPSGQESRAVPIRCSDVT